MIETLILIGVGAFFAGAALGWWLAQRVNVSIERPQLPQRTQHPIVHDVHVAKVSQEQAEELLDLIFPNLAKHPYRHPEMEEEDDC
ncbi:MAG: hypothetical protein HLX46_02605 [Corynebacterium sp.]|uniref:hypothetical protein n=1 Tax=Corynebacterium sp. TaxID=1720 RepID=UPI00181935BA|nr:hypothetical protein [Corynebacterium sp.]NWO15741.1 hypothetical protein [Corynebacterium sp.]